MIVDDSFCLNVLKAGFSRIRLYERIGFFLELRS